MANQTKILHKSGPSRGYTYDLLNYPKCPKLAKKKEVKINQHSFLTTLQFLTMHCKKTKISEEVNGVEAEGAN